MRCVKLRKRLADAPVDHLVRAHLLCNDMRVVDALLHPPPDLPVRKELAGRTNASTDAPAVDARLQVHDTEDRLAGWCSIWWRDTPTLDGERVGYIGHYAAADKQVATRLLRAACDRLRQAGVAQAVGPIDGDTWHTYRFITQRGSRPPIFLEPDHPTDWPIHFTESGFNPLATYVSSEGSDLAVRVPKLEKVGQRLRNDGLTFRSLRLKRFEDELAKLHDLSTASFASNFLYSPISREAFIQMYQPLRKMIVEELVLMAERDGELAGFAFAVPDRLQAQRGEAMDTVILKTLAVRPGRRNAGLGGLLMEQCHLKARTLGFRRVIHAMMHESNKSLSLSKNYATPFRRYAIFSRDLAR